jgi:predicted nucleic acid-binding protein
MMSKVFLDTNILVYCLDQSLPDKKKRCRDLLRNLSNENKGVISTQIMQEFYVAATKKLKAVELLVKDILHSFKRFEIVIVSPGLIQEAIDCSIIHRLSFWDSLIVVAAESAHCHKIWTEDLNDGQIIRGVRIENPLAIR